MTTAQRIAALARSGLTREAIAAILDVDEATIQEVRHSPGVALGVPVVNASGGGGGGGGPLPSDISGLPPRVDSVEGRLTAVEAALNITPPDPTWTEPPLLGTFGTTDAALAAGHPKFGYKLLEDGITLLLRGRIDKGFGSTNGNMIVALPFVPFNHQDAFFWRNGPTYTDGSQNSGYFRSNGTIDLNISNGGTWIDLEGLGFSVTAA